MQPGHMSFLIRAITSTQGNDTLESLLMAQANLPHPQLHPSLLVQLAQAENWFGGSGGMFPTGPIRPQDLKREKLMPTLQNVPETGEARTQLPGAASGPSRKLAAEPEEATVAGKLAFAGLSEKQQRATVRNEAPWTKGGGRGAVCRGPLI